jgi:hypothetical protein
VIVEYCRLDEINALASIRPPLPASFLEHLELKRRPPYDLVRGADQVAMSPASPDLAHPALLMTKRRQSSAGQSHAPPALRPPQATL